MDKDCFNRLSKVNRYSLTSRKSKVQRDFLASNTEKSSSFKQFYDNLPNILAVNELKTAVQAIISARANSRPVILAMGAHPIKTGLSPLIIELLKKDIITALATNGASIIHDFELSLMGYTSEEVGSALCDGAFGMAEETGIILNKAIIEGNKKQLGLGEAIGKLIVEDNSFINKDISIFASFYELRRPATVHVAVGTDIIHMHPEADGGAIGETSLRDFKLLTLLLTDLSGGVFINLGSAVIMPEVFLKALSLARNTGHKVENFTTINMDFIKHYRAQVNVLHRPTSASGRAINLIGHHEIMFPLLCAALMEEL
ncbi:hypothetical protein MCHI_002873 [Candidatus Magnetoovum chiemensis]|nr:hypothetical protein MCHI_002873 [Candidatus Magnetoovum chiemensis]